MSRFQQRLQQSLRDPVHRRAYFEADDEVRGRAYMPHCDSLVLHAPGECAYCDEYPEWQEYRKRAGINFTGQRNSLKVPCPSENRRPLEVIERWAGNRPRKEKL